MDKRWQVYQVQSAEGLFNPVQTYVGIAQGDIPQRVAHLRNTKLRTFFQAHHQAGETAIVHCLEQFDLRAPAVEYQTDYLNELNQDGYNVLNGNRIKDRGLFKIMDKGVNNV